MVRPAVCLTEPVGPYEHVVLAFITSRMPDNLLESDVVLDSGREGYGGAGLRVASVLRLHRLMTVAVPLIQRELGVLPTEAQDEIGQKLRGLFGLS
jgi:mRNA interferase MazF